MVFTITSPLHSSPSASLSPAAEQPPRCLALLVAASTSEQLSCKLRSITPNASAQLLSQ